MFVSLLFQCYVLIYVKMQCYPFYIHVSVSNKFCLYYARSVQRNPLCVFMCVCSFLQEADIAVAPLTLTAKRETAVDMTKPFMQTGLSFILRKDLASDDSQFLSLLNLFSTEMWMGILVAYLLTSICIFLVSR